MRKILAHYDTEGVWVYQAFKPSIVQEALRLGTFGKGFGLDRMTWIKPSFGWMLYRSGYATKHRQEAILKIKIMHAGFLEILRQAIETSFNPQLFAAEHEWAAALARSDVRVQWDPDRALSGAKLERRAIQIGIRGAAVQQYVNEWIIKLEEVTELARQIGAAVDTKQKALPAAPEEAEYVVDDELRKTLGMSL